MNKSERFKLLLERGYFPEELPPPFNTHDIAKFRQIIWSKWSEIPNEYPRTTAESYSIPKADRMRRQLSIVNPIAQLHVSKPIADEWVAISKSLAGSYSVTVPQIVSDGVRAVPLPDFSLLAQRRSELAASYDAILSVDISRFYGTLYTHAIPWAMHTKTWSKTNLYLPAYGSSLGARIDKAIRKGQDNQTLGIPVGPDTSRIVAELVGAAIDRQLRASRAFAQDQVYRFVDDSFVGFDTPGEASDAISAFAAACRLFELELNEEKTGVVVSNGSQVDTSWATDLKQHSLAGSASIQARRLEHFVAKAFDFASRCPGDGVLDYAVKRTRGVVIYAANWHRYETFLLHAARTNGRVVPAVAQILTNYKFRGYALGITRIEKLIHDIVVRGAPLAHYAEVAWALFLAKALRLTISPDSCAAVSTTESSVCALLALDLETRGLAAAPLDKTAWNQAMSSEGLRSNNWLLAYEADLKGWLAGTVPNHVDSDPYFRELKIRGISFYDVRSNVPRMAHTRITPTPVPDPAAHAIIAGYVAPVAAGEDDYDFLQLSGMTGYFML